MEQVKIKCEYKKMVPIKEPCPHPKNPNTHSKDQIERLAHIIEYQGFRNPIIVSNLSNKIVAGHGRLAAAKKLKIKEVPVDYQDFQNEDQEYAHLVADNAIHEWSELDFKSINDVIPELGPDLDIDMLGLKDFEIDVAEKKIDELELDENIKTENECPSCGYKW